MIETTNIARKTIRGSFWTFSLQFSDRMLQIVKNIILARILSPSDFGVFGVATLALVALESFSETGFVYALIQKRDTSAKHYNTAWTTHIIKDILLALVLLLTAPFIGRLFDSPASVSLLRVIGLSTIFQGFINIYTAKLEKNFSFGQVFKYRFLGSALDITASIIAVIMLKSVWALVIGLIVGNLTRMIMSYIVIKERPKFQFDKTSFSELWRFGRWALFSSAIIFLAGYGDNIAVQKILGVSSLGVYAMAFKLSNTPATEISRVIGRVTLPAFSAIQDTVERVKKGYLQVTFVTSVLAIGLAALIFGTAYKLTTSLLGPSWLPMIIPLQILTISGVLRALTGTVGPIYYALGKPKIDTLFQIIRFAIMVALLFPLTLNYGLAGTAVSALAGMAVSTVGFIAIALKVIKCPAIDFLKVILPSLLAAVGSIALSALVTPIIDRYTSNLVFQFISQGLFIGISYCVILFVVDRLLQRRIQHSFQMLVATIKNDG